MHMNIHYYGAPNINCQSAGIATAVSFLCCFLNRLCWTSVCSELSVLCPFDLFYLNCTGCKKCFRPSIWVQGVIHSWVMIGNWTGNLQGHESIRDPMFSREGIFFSKEGKVILGEMIFFFIFLEKVSRYFLKEFFLRYGPSVLTKYLRWCNQIINLSIFSVVKLMGHLKAQVMGIESVKIYICSSL